MKKLEYKIVWKRVSSITWISDLQAECNTYAADGYLIVNHIMNEDQVLLIMAREKEE